jgi:hypothetical protein
MVGACARWLLARSIPRVFKHLGNDTVFFTLV